MKISTTHLFLCCITTIHSVSACPTMHFICPGSNTGFSVDTKFDWDLSCHKTKTLINAAMQSCPNHNRCGANWTDRADGCSVPIPGLNEILSAIFDEACDLHDMCYSATGNSKNFCDSSFNINLVQLCNIPGLNSIIQPICVATAQSMWLAVTAAGQPSYENDQRWGESHCQSNYAQAATYAWYNTGKRATSLQNATQTCQHLEKDSRQWQLPTINNVIQQKEIDLHFISEAMYHPFWIQQSDIQYIYFNREEKYAKNTIMLGSKQLAEGINVICMTTE